MTTDGASPVAVVRAEASRLHESAVWSSQGQFEAAKLWRSVNWTVGLLATATSLVAGVLAFAQNQQFWIGLLAISGALGTAVQTTLNPGRRSESAQDSAQQYLALRNRARQLRDIHAETQSADSLTERLESLTADFAQVDSAADPIPRWSYRRAKRNIEREGGQQFEVDRT